MNKKQTWICDKCNDAICEVSKQIKKGFPDDDTPPSLIENSHCLAPSFKDAEWRLKDEPGQGVSSKKNSLKERVEHAPTDGGKETILECRDCNVKNDWTDDNVSIMGFMYQHSTHNWGYDIRDKAPPDTTVKDKE